MTPLAAWQSFYVIVGSSAGALIGLQFVVMALVANLGLNRGTGAATDAFGTPTVVHFGTALLLAAILSAPWRGVAIPTVLCGVCGGIGLVYTGVVLRRARTQTEYVPVFEDWLFHVFLPALAYALLAAAAIAVRFRLDLPLFGVAAAVMLLLFVGIHNAWDSVTYMVFIRGREQP